jgi:hypothetical protein
MSGNNQEAEELGDNKDSTDMPGDDQDAENNTGMQKHF